MGVQVRRAHVYGRAQYCVVLCCARLGEVAVVAAKEGRRWMTDESMETRAHGSSITRLSVQSLTLGAGDDDSGRYQSGGGWEYALL